MNLMIGVVIEAILVELVITKDVGNTAVQRLHKGVN
jgi:hypothetical protein